MPPKITVCSPTISPARTESSAISFLPRSPTMPLTAVDGDFIEIAVERVCDRTPKCQRRAARRVFLEAMMRFDDLDVVIVAEHLRRLTQERNKNVDSQAGVRREQRRRAPGKPFDFGLLFGIEPSRGNDDRRKFFRRAP